MAYVENWQSYSQLKLYFFHWHVDVDVDVDNVQRSELVILYGILRYVRVIIIITFIIIIIT